MLKKSTYVRESARQKFYIFVNRQIVQYNILKEN